MGASRREMPAQFGYWHTADSQYQDWQRSGLWPQILVIVRTPELDHAPELSL